jgi:hypothetical protein
LELHALFPEFSLQYFENHVDPQKSWVYFIKRKDYPRSITALNRWLESGVTEEEKKHILSWRDLVNAAHLETTKLGSNPM